MKERRLELAGHGLNTIEQRLKRNANLEATNADLLEALEKVQTMSRNNFTGFKTPDIILIVDAVVGRARQ